MGFIEIPDLPVLRGDEAIEALSYFINQVEEQRGKKLTEKQAEVLLKVANALIITVKAETRTTLLDKAIKSRCDCEGFAFFRKPSSK